MILLLVHGWGFDASVWDPLAERLGDDRIVRFDAGYFGPGADAQPHEPFVAIAHSLGTMRVLAGPLDLCRGLVAINGFDRFTAANDAEGVSGRVVERMIARFEQTPDAVVRDFRARVAAPEVMAAPRVEALAADLRLLLDGDCRDAVSRLQTPLLSMQGGSDPLLPAAMRDTVFARAQQLERVTCADAGHLLPITDPDYCALQIRRFLERLP